jgi:DNA gyrase subunit A
LLQLNPGEKITAAIALKEYGEDQYLFMATKNGIVKKTALKEYANVRKTGLAAITLKDGDELIQVKITDNTKDIFMVTKLGMCIRFNETDVRSTGRTSQGVIGMNLSDGDEVIGMQMDSQGTDLLIVSEKGMGKRTSMEEFTPQRRGGKGVKCYKINAKTGNVVGMKAVNDENQIMIISTEGIVIRLECTEISELGRITSGVKLIRMDEAKDILVASIAKVRDKSPEDSIAEFEAQQAEEEKKNK